MSTPAFTLTRNPLGRLVCTLADGSEHVGVLPVRAFPIAAPDEGVSLVGPAGHELVWIEHHGPVPRGCVVVFKPGQKTADLQQITIDRIECITRAELMLRNSSWTNLPPEVARLVQLRGALNRQINRITRKQQDEKSA